MHPSQYLLHVNTAPISVSHDLWKKWYTTEHLPDLIKNGVGMTGTFYKEQPNPITGEPPTSERPFLAIYDTNFAAPITTPNFSQCRTTSQLFTEEGAPEEISKNINADARVYELVQNYDPHSYGHKPSAAMMSVEVSTPDPKDFDKWMKEEHLPLYSKLPGLHRALRYKSVPNGVPPPISKSEVPTYLHIYYAEDVKTFADEQVMKAAETEWCHKHMKLSEDAGPLAVRGWSLVGSEGW